MGRHSLRLTMLLGVLITALGGTGIFAVFTDRATTGTNSAETGSRPHAVDLRISEAVLAGGAVNCDGEGDTILFEDDNLLTGIFSVTNMQPVSGPGSGEAAYVCLLNNGSGTIDVESTVIDLVDTETGCTGDEAAAGDASCGAGLVGELSPYVAAQMERLDCDTAASTPIQSNSLANWVANPAPVTTAATPLAPGDIACVAFYLWVPASTPEATIQLIQSDRVQWRFAFDAALAS